MKSKLALILGLAAFLSLDAIAIAGTGSAGAALPLASVNETLLPGLTGSSSSSSTEATPSGTTTTPSTTTNTPPATTTPTGPQGADGIYNDGDGLIDMEDPDCSSPTDNTEGPEVSTSPSTPPTRTPASPSTSTSGATEGEPIGAAPEPTNEKPEKHKDFGRGESLEEN